MSWAPSYRSGPMHMPTVHQRFGQVITLGRYCPSRRVLNATATVCRSMQVAYNATYTYKVDAAKMQACESPPVWVHVGRISSSGSAFRGRGNRQRDGG